MRRKTSTRRHWAAIAATALFVVGVSGDLAGGALAKSAVAQASADVADATEPSLSADGRWVVFTGNAEGRSTVFRTDLELNTTTELSPVPPSVRAGDTIRARLSADGCVVVAITEIPFDLFRDDDRDERWDVYRLLVPECGGQPNSWELISLSQRNTLEALAKTVQHIELETFGEFFHFFAEGVQFLPIHFGGKQKD